MVEMETIALTGNREGQMVWMYRCEDKVATEVSRFTGNADGFSESVRESTGLLRLAEDRDRWKQFVNYGKVTFAHNWL